MTKESCLPNVLGINRNEIRELRARHLVENEDWLWDGNSIVYTDEAIKKIRAALRLDDPEKSAPASTVAQSQPLPEPIILHVFKPQLTNKRMILAYKPGTDPTIQENQLRVRVKSNENFVRYVNGKPMELLARHVQADLYELATHCPRWKGRW